jgi:hypothetical protein
VLTIRRALVGLLTLATVSVLSGCVSADPWEEVSPVPVDADPAVLAEQATEQAETLGRLLQEVEARFALEAPELEILDAGTPAEEVATVLADAVPVNSQARAFLWSHAEYVEQQWSRDTPAREVTVVAGDAEVLGVASGDPVASVPVRTTYVLDDGTRHESAVDYAVSWRETTSSGEVRLMTVRPLYEDDDAAALDSGAGKGSPLGAVHDYVRAVTHGSSGTIDRFEGTVRTSEELRSALKDRLLAVPRYTPVEVPCARMGSTHVVYLVQDGADELLRFDVDVSGDDPVLVPYL